MGILKIAGRVIFLVSLCCFTGEVSLAEAASRQAASSPESSQLQDAAREISAGKLDLASKELHSVLRSTPGDYRALDLLGVVEVLQKQPAKAEELFGEVVKSKPDFAPGHAHLGLVYLQEGRVQDAAPELREAVRLDPGRSDAAGALVHILQDQAQIARQSENLDRALALLIEARKYAPDNPDVLYEFGVVALRLSLADDAIEAFRQTLKLRNNDSMTIYNLGRALTARGKMGDARQQFARYVEIRPDDPSGHCALGMTLDALDHSEEARTQFERSIALAPAQSESYYQLGLLDLNAGDYDAATRDLHRALDHKPDDASALTALGRVDFEQKHYPEALSLLQQALSNDDSLREAHYYLGLTLARMGRKLESSEQLEIAARLENEEKERSRTVLRIREPGDLKQQEFPSSK